MTPIPSMVKKQSKINKNYTIMSNYKTNDISIISRSAKKEVKPTKVVIPNLDYSVKNLLISNPHDHPTQQKPYSRDMPDIAYKSTQDIHKMHRDLKEKTKDLTEKQVEYLTTVPTTRNNPDAY